MEGIKKVAEPEGQAPAQQKEENIFVEMFRRIVALEERVDALEKKPNE